MPRPPDRPDHPSSTEVSLACEALQDILQHLTALGRMGGGAVSGGLLQAAIDDCPDAVVVADSNARIVMVNGAVARLLGISTRELQALTLWDIMHTSSQPDFEVLWREFLRAGRQRGAYALRHHSGSEVSVAYCCRRDVLPDQHVWVLRRLNQP